MRRLVVDGQVFQTPAWHRGMGKYSLELLRSMSNLSGENKWDSIEIILSKQVKSDTKMLTELHKKIDNLKVLRLDLKINEIGDTSIAGYNRKSVDQYIQETKEQSDKIDYLILSLMQGEIVPTFPTNDKINKLLLFYDLIPLMFHDIYLQNPITRIEYLSKIKELLKADRYLCISKTAANDLALYLGIDASRIINVDGGPIEHHANVRAIKVPKPFILMPTGNDLRKNNRRGIIGFNEFNKSHENKYTLVITSFFKDYQIQELSKLSNHVIFTGNIDGDELSYLYENTDALFFPSEYEGLGLPILEAVEKDKPIACSNISVFNEMSKSAFQYFEPTSTVSMAQALGRAVSVKDIDHTEYQRIIKKYTWKNTAEMILNILRTENGDSHHSKIKLAIFGLDPTTSEIGRVMQEEHAELSRYADVEYFLNPVKNKPEPRIDYLPYISSAAPIMPGLPFDAENYDAVLYNITNDKASADTLIACLAVPGVVILHDTILDDVWQSAVDKGLIGPMRQELETKIEQKFEVKGSSHLATLLSKQKAVIVISEADEKKVKQIISKTQSKINVYRTSLPVTTMVYPEAIPNKVISFATYDEGLITVANQEIESKTDFAFNEILSKIGALLLPDLNTLPVVLACIKFSVIPIIVADKRSEDDLMSQLAVRYKTLELAERSAQDSLIGGIDYKTFKKNGLKYAKDFSPKNFAQLLQVVLGRI